MLPVPVNRTVQERLLWRQGRAEAQRDCLVWVAQLLDAVGGEVRVPACVLGDLDDEAARVHITEDLATGERVFCVAPRGRR